MHIEKIQKQPTDHYSYYYHMKLSKDKKLYLRFCGNLAFSFLAFETNT